MCSWPDFSHYSKLDNKKTPDPHTTSVVRDESYRGATLIHRRLCERQPQGLPIGDLIDNGIIRLHLLDSSMQLLWNAKDDFSVTGLHQPPALWRR